jgi:hypothetical protein
VKFNLKSYIRGKSMKGIVLPKILLCCLILLFISSCNINSTEVLSDAYKKITEKTNSVNENAFQTNKYFLEIQLDDSRNILFGSEKVIYANKSNTGLKEIYFHIYPNAFSREQTVPVLFSNTKYSYPQGFKPCHIDIENLKVNNRSASFTIEGIDETLLRVKLNKTLKPGDSIDISMGFKIQIPEMRERVGFLMVPITLETGILLLQYMMNPDGIWIPFMMLETLFTAKPQIMM